jgi:hypothetical protein
MRWVVVTTCVWGYVFNSIPQRLRAEDQVMSEQHPEAGFAEKEGRGALVSNRCNGCLDQMTWQVAAF